MEEARCIFVERPDWCVICLESRKLGCLVNKETSLLRLTEQGKESVIREVERLMNHPDRVKGEETG